MDFDRDFVINELEGVLEAIKNRRPATASTRVGFLLDYVNECEERKRKRELELSHPKG